MEATITMNYRDFQDMEEEIRQLRELIKELYFGNYLSYKGQEKVCNYNNGAYRIWV